MKCNFLRCVDSQNRFADFHSNRHTFLTNLSLVGVSPRDAQELAHHNDIHLTMNLYSHVGLQDKARAIGKLAAVGGRRYHGGGLLLLRPHASRADPGTYTLS